MKVINCQTLGEICTTLLDGEPVFVIRAKDIASVAALQDYKKVSVTMGGKNIGRTQDAINTFSKWQQENPGKVKVPD